MGSPSDLATSCYLAGEIGKMMAFELGFKVGVGFAGDVRNLGISR